MSSNKPTAKELPFNEIIGKLLFERVLNKPFTAMADLAWFRKYLGKHEALFNIPEPVKSDVRSGQLRQEGNRFFREQKYREALARYNEGICYAEPGSQELGLGYANRSAVYYEQAEYEFALANIGLARKHNYPETLAPKLRERELNCHAKLDAGHKRGTVPCPRMGINVETAGPKIPFVANHLRMKVTPELGRGVYAKRDFRPGDVLLDERPMMTVMDGKLRYLNCSWCGTENFHSLVPCTECVLYMYCGEECLIRDRETCHRFECGIAGKLREFAYCNTVFGPKLFFYGLSLFKDNVQQMMEYCKAHAQTGGNPLQIDYSKNDHALQEFKEFAKVVSIMKMKHGFVHRFCAALYDMMFEKHVPLVRSIIKTKAQKNFMLHTIHDFSQLAVMLSFNTGPKGLFINMFPSVASLFNHSCDPNAVIVLDAGRVKIAVLRPIRSGEQICISNGPNFWEPKSEEDDDPDFICKCVVCDPATKAAWLAHARKLPPQAVLHWRVLTKILNQEQGGPANDAAKLNALQQYVQRYAYIHPCPDWTAALHVYQGMLRVLTKKENEALARAAALAAAELLN